MKPSKRNIARMEAAKGKYSGPPPVQSKYSAKVRAQYK